MMITLAFNELISCFLFMQTIVNFHYKTDSHKTLKTLWPLFMDGVQGYIAITRKQFTFYHSFPRNSWYSFNWPRKDERLSRSCSGFEHGTHGLGIYFVSIVKRIKLIFFQNGPDYRYSVLFKIPALVELDLIPVSAEEKVFS